MPEDAELLRRYACEKSNDAFAELVRRHLSLVYAVALRQVAGDAHLAQDVAQEVFTALARKASLLADRPSLSGWLYRSTHFAASDMVRRERRRRSREQEAYSMHMHDTTRTTPPAGEWTNIDWEKVRPSIDAAIAELDERDRDAVALRFFDGRSFAEVGACLQLTENAARMRVERALDKLQAVLSRRGVRSTAAALGLALAHQVSGVAPGGLAATIAGSAAAGAGGAGFWAIMGSTKFVLGVAVGVAAIVTGVAGLQYQRKNHAETALAVAEQRQRAVQNESTTPGQRLADAERPARGVDNDKVESPLAVQNGTVTLTLLSDGNTWVSIRNFRAPEKFSTMTLKVPSGDYLIVGRRKGYRDVTVPLQVRKGDALSPISVVCTVSVDSRE